MNSIIELEATGCEYAGWGWHDGVRLSAQDEGYDTLAFIGVEYPAEYVINPSRGWRLGSGVVVSDLGLNMIRSQIIAPDGSIVSDSGERMIYGQSYSVCNLDDDSVNDNGVRFSRIMNEEEYIWRLSARDSIGRYLEMNMEIDGLQKGTVRKAVAEKRYIDAESVELSKETLELFVGEKDTLLADVKPITAMERSVEWMSSNPQVVSVSENGELHALKYGNAVITCRTVSDGHTAVCNVKVKEFSEVKKIETASRMLENGEMLVEFSVTTNRETELLRVQNESDNTVRLIAEDFVDTDEGRRWLFDMIFTEEGQQQLGIVAVHSDGTQSAIEKCSIAVECSKVISAAYDPPVSRVGSPAKAIVVTSKGAKYLALYTEDGSQIAVYSDTQYAVVLDNRKIWQVPYVFNGKGDRQLSFKASADNKMFSEPGEFAELKVGIAPKITYAVYNYYEDADGSILLVFTVKTGIDTSRISLYSGRDQLVKAVTEGYTDANGVRTWVIEHSIEAGEAFPTAITVADMDGVESEVYFAASDRENACESENVF